jgi:hypothetical protein
MIELPRACFVANRIARFADFFSFGTNDLTQPALGFSRDDAEKKFVPAYVERKIVERSPFETIDRLGLAGSCGSRAGSGTRRTPISNWGFAASTVAIRSRSASPRGLAQLRLVLAGGPRVSTGGGCALPGSELVPRPCRRGMVVA